MKQKTVKVEMERDTHGRFIIAKKKEELKTGVKLKNQTFLDVIVTEGINVRGLN